MRDTRFVVEVLTRRNGAEDLSFTGGNLRLRAFRQQCESLGEDVFKRLSCEL